MTRSAPRPSNSYKFRVRCLSRSVGFHSSLLRPRNTQILHPRLVKIHLPLRALPRSGARAPVLGCPWMGGSSMKAVVETTVDYKTFFEQTVLQLWECNSRLAIANEQLSDAQDKLGQAQSDFDDYRANMQVFPNVS